MDMIHGNKRFSLGEDLGSGSYTKDISPWVLGYILGVEWEDTTVALRIICRRKGIRMRGNICARQKKQRL